MSMCNNNVNSMGRKAFLWFLCFYRDILSRTTWTKVKYKNHKSWTQTFLLQAHHERRDIPHFNKTIIIDGSGLFIWLAIPKKRMSRRKAIINNCVCALKNCPAM
jgi:hypothetical protein